MASRASARVAYLAYRAGAGAARLVPDVVGAPTARAVAQLAGPITSPARMRQVERNLARIHREVPLSPAARRRAVAATFDSYGRYFYELFRLPGASPAWIEDRTTIHGTEHLRAAHDAGKGAVLALPHLGNWDFAGAWLAAQGYDVAVVAEQLEPPELYDFFVQTRAQLGMRVIGLSPSAAHESLTALRDNAMVCLLSDRDLTGDGVEVELLGERTTLPGGPALLALRSGAPLIPVGCYFRPHGRQEIEVRAPLPTEREAGLRADVTRVTQALADAFGELIRAAPTDWHMLQPNWPSDRGAAPVAPQVR